MGGFSGAAALAVAFAGCGAPMVWHERVVARLPEAEPTSRFNFSEISRQELLSRWDFDRSAPLAPWSVKQSPEWREDGLAVPEEGLRLVAALNLDAGAVDGLLLDLPGLRTAKVVVAWAGQGQEWSPLRQVAVDYSASERTQLAVHLREHPRWQGVIGRLAAKITAAKGDKGAVAAIAAYRRRLVPDRLASASARAWTVELDGDRRSAILLPPRTQRDWVVDVPDGARLRGALGLVGAAREPIRLFVSGVAADSSEQLLFEHRLEPSEERSTVGWQEVDIDLSRFAGEKLRLRFVASGGHLWDPALALPCWASLRIIGRRDGPAPPDVLLIVLDTLRADHLSLYGYERPTSPRLDALARRRGIVFDDVVASSPWTLPSHVSLFTGLEAFRHGVNFDFAAPDDLDTLAEQFRAAGYETWASTAGGFVSPTYGLAQGFDVFRTRNWRPTARHTNELEVGLDELEQRLTPQGSPPSFAFFHTYETHDPYWAREPFFSRFAAGTRAPESGYVAMAKLPLDAGDGYALRKRFVLQKGAGPEAGEPDPELVRALYDSEVAYTDSLVGPLLERLLRFGWLDKGIVALTSDHGESLGEHGLAGHIALYEDTLRVPLILWLPGAQGGGTRISDTVRLVDVAPTLLEVAGITAPSGIDGESLAPLLAGKARRAPTAWSYGASTNRGLAMRLGSQWKLILNNRPWAPLSRRREVYDLRQDPDESDNLARGAHAEHLEPLARRALEAIPGVRLRFVSPRESPLRGRVSGPGVGAFSVSSPDLDCDCATWIGAGRVALDVPAGTDYVLVFERPRGSLLWDPLTRDDAAARPTGRELPLPSGTEKELRRIALTDGRELSQEAADARAEPHVEIWSVGLLTAAEATEGPPDPRARSLLEALGYVD